jgi:hypothetical protein
VDEQVDGRDALPQAGLQPFPLAPSITRGTMSMGMMRSVPAPSLYTLKVMPICIRARSAACCRRSSSSLGSDSTRF